MQFYARLTIIRIYNIHIGCQSSLTSLYALSTSAHLEQMDKPNLNVTKTISRTKKQRLNVIFIFFKHEGYFNNIVIN